MRDIAARAGVNQALIGYYFGAKQDLFDEVFRRRGTRLAQHRKALLETLLGSDASPTVEAILQAYLKPQWDMKYSGANGAAFVQLQARLHAEPEEHALRLRREGAILPLDQLMQVAMQRYPGAVLLEVELEEEDGVLVYEVELVTQQGIVRELELHAGTGEVLKDEVDD